MSDTEPSAPTHFIRNRIRDDIEAGRDDGRVVTRFPPEPNGYLHIGHAKSIHVNFGMAEEFGGVCNLRFDDTNPLKEEALYYQSIQDDVHWLGYEWAELRHASDYFQQLYDFAVHLVRAGKAYVDSLAPEQIREYRGTLTEPGRDSPYRDRPVAESLDLFERMKDGEFADGEHVLRAKIDMASGNINLRDPVLYRIRNAPHHRTDDAWCIYPMYDYAHCVSDALEGVTHSLCTLEFEDHRPLYDWILDNIPAPCHPQQIEFARLNIDFTVLSKRRLGALVDDGHVEGWDDPRMPTLAALRRRGFTPRAIRNFCAQIGVSKQESVIPMGVLENALRDDLNERAPRTMAVLEPLKVVLNNFPEGETRWVKAPVHPQNPDMGEREIPLTREVYIEAVDFMEDPPKKFFRLKPGGEVRLRNAFIIRCEKVIKDDHGNIVELRCSYDPETESGKPGAGRKVKGTIHWVSAEHAVPAEVRLYDRLFSVPNPVARSEQDFREHLNPESLRVIERAMLEPGMERAQPEAFYQFERTGYFVPDPDGTPERPVFNRAVSLRDTWAKYPRA